MLSFSLKNVLILLTLIFLFACSQKKQTIFTQLSSNKTGIHFNNEINDKENDSTLISEFAYMGGGVGIGDFNNDGLKDIFFCGNQVSCKLYINKGNNHFEDVTEKAGLATNMWATGVSIVDINNDGYDDIYVCVFGKNLSQRAKNLLFINQHNLTFKEEAADYGLADSSYSTQAVFFDYDKDGDLDMYLLNYMLHGPNPNEIYPKNLSGSSPANDKLYRNDGDIHHTGHPYFKDVSREAGIKEDGYGLGVVISDFNNDTWPDIYVSDDFLSNDELWLNNKNGTFTNCISKALKHQSYSAMGADAADINNDCLTDIATLDMQPENNERKKISYSFMNYDRYELERSMNYEPEFMRNMLQLNNGVQMLHDTAMPFFSEIGQLAGISETDWSWSILMADFNNDGYKDIHITNGIGRDFINADFVQFTTTTEGMSETEKRKLLNEKLASLDHVNLKNYFYLNNRNYTFTDASSQAGIDELSMSNGAAYADLDNDGDLDLVVNNIDKEAFIFINNTIQKNITHANHCLQLMLEGDTLNRCGFGSKIFLYTGGFKQMQEQNPVRGYLSTVDTKITFGLGTHSKADSIVVIWPDNKMQVIKNISGDTLLTINKKDANEEYYAPMNTTLQLFTDVTNELKTVYKHTDAPYNDFAIQRLLPQKYSQLGPFITTGDINNDGLTDFFIGGGFNSWGKIFIQQKNGTFTSKPLADTTKMQEDVDCILFDADNDKDLDLLITCGDTRYDENSPYYIPRLYINDGKGNFSLSANAIPSTTKTISGCVTTADYDGDGDLDIFIGGRVSKQYPLSPKSFILQNDHGVFTDVTAKVCPALQKAGMITSAVWTDFDNDKQPDLIIAGEWMSVRFFKNNRGRLQEVTNSTGLSQTNGLWRSLAACDMDGDGDIDIVAGNLGLNCNYHTSENEPMKLFAEDLDNNGSIDPVMFYYIKTDNGTRKLFPAISKDVLASQVPSVRKQFLHNKEFADAGFDDIFPSGKRTNLVELTCNETRSCYFENKGKGKFVKHVLPVEAQFAPVNAIVCEDINNDGIKDILLAGNEYQAEVMNGRYDASYGCFLKGKGNNQFIAIPPAANGFILNGDIKNLKLLQEKNGDKFLLVAVNNDYLKVLKINKQQ
jgi:hypothetical protein